MNKKLIIKYLILLAAVALMLVGLIGYEREILKESQRVESEKEDQVINNEARAVQLIETQHKTTGTECPKQ